MKRIIAIRLPDGVWWYCGFCGTYGEGLWFDHEDRCWRARLARWWRKWFE